MFSRQRGVVGRTDEEKCNEKDATHAIELCFRTFHSRAAQIMQLKTGGIDQRLQKTSKAPFFRDSGEA